MLCAKCKEKIEKGDEHELHGQILCEDCYLDCLSPAKACDPWAVYSAKSFATADESKVKFTETQSKILHLLKETGGVEPEILIQQLQITPSDLERAFSTLRHMEKARAELREGKKIFRLW